MPREGYPHPLRSRDYQQTADPRDDLVCGLDLTADADLHVIDQQRHALRMAHVPECSRYGQTMSVFHSPLPYRQIRHVRPASDASRLNSFVPVRPLITTLAQGVSRSRPETDVLLLSATEG